MTQWEFKMNDARITIRLDKKIMDGIDKVAKKEADKFEQPSKAKIIRQACLYYLENKHKLKIK